MSDEGTFEEGHITRLLRPAAALAVAALFVTAFAGPVSAHDPSPPACGGERYAVLGDRADWAAVELVGWVLDTGCLVGSGDRADDGLPADTQQALGGRAQRVVVVGGAAAVPASKLDGLTVERRLWGADRLETMRAVIDWADGRDGTNGGHRNGHEPESVASCTHWHAGAPKHTHTKYGDGTVSGHSHAPSLSTKCGYLWR
ncbi:MAG: hypothetical protein OXB99_04825 [Acidimicrobiaceae bacterium]|nr:hypothetical protein [Acidimicrobiaceae bacterium]